MRIALAHELLTQLGGAERVLHNFLQIWPEADLHVIVHNPDKVGHVFDSYHIKTSFVNNLPMAQRDHKWYLALMPKAIESFDFSSYDVVLSDSSSFAKGVKTGNVLHICYCHTPTRFLWTERDNYVKTINYPFFIKWAAQIALSFIKKWDYKVSQRVDYYIANSKNVQNRIKKYYHRDSVVIPPPVDTNLFYPEGKKGNYYFVASRLEPYKKIELVIEAFNKNGLPLKVAGSGTNAENLKAIARPNIEFLDRVSDEELRRRYSECLAYIFPADEDAGIMVLEAQACGTPVIAYGAGGSLETIIPGVTGEFFSEQTSDSLQKVLDSFNSSKYDPEKIREHAQNFDQKIFQIKIRKFVEEKFDEFARKKIAEGIKQ